MKNISKSISLVPADALFAAICILQINYLADDLKYHFAVKLQFGEWRVFLNIIRINVKLSLSVFRKKIKKIKNWSADPHQNSYCACSELICLPKRDDKVFSIKNVHTLAAV